MTFESCSQQEIPSFLYEPSSILLVSAFLFTSSTAFHSLLIFPMAATHQKCHWEPAAFLWWCPGLCVGAALQWPDTCGTAAWRLTYTLQLHPAIYKFPTEKLSGVWACSYRSSVTAATACLVFEIFWTGCVKAGSVCAPACLRKWHGYTATSIDNCVLG